jgi:transposase-like protein
MTEIPSAELIALARRLAEAGKLPLMQRPFSERRYSDEELARILEDAAQSEVQGESASEENGGHTLAEIRDIAREAGIDPEQVDRAAARLVADAGAAERSPFARGWSDRPVVSRVVHEERVIGRALSDAEMRALAQQVELVLNQPGHDRAWGDWVEWRDEKDRLYVGIVRGGGKTRIRVISDVLKDSQSGLVAIAMVTVLIAAGLPGPAMLIPLLAITAAAIWKLWGWQNAKTRRYLNELLDILEDSVRSH